MKYPGETQNSLVGGVYSSPYSEYDFSSHPTICITGLRQDGDTQVECGKLLFFPFQWKEGDHVSMFACGIQGSDTVEMITGALHLAEQPSELHKQLCASSTIK